MAMTRRQREMYDFISDFIKLHGYSPSFEEIKQGMRLKSLATVHKHVTNMERKKLLTRDYNKSRSIDLIPLRGLLAKKGKTEKTPMAPVDLALPLMGRIAAGQPIEAMQNPETISLGDITRSKDVYVLEVRGDSMMDDHILSGDYVLVEKVKSARNGEIVVALVDGMETTLKRIFKEGEQIRLQPANATMQPIMVAAASVQIQGRVIGVLRKY